MSGEYVESIFDGSSDIGLRCRNLLSQGMKGFLKEEEMGEELENIGMMYSGMTCIVAVWKNLISLEERVRSRICQNDLMQN